MSGFQPEKIRVDFPTLSRRVRDRRLVYLDNAASTLKPRPVIDRMTRYYEDEVSNVHRGAHYLAEQGTIAYEAARAKVAAFIGAASPAEVVFTRGTTESINLVAQTYGRANLNAGDEILVSELEHHSNIVPWQMIAGERGARVRAIPVTDSGEIDFAAYSRLLSTRTRLVAISWCSNALGTVTDVKAFVDAAHAVGARVVVDAAQAIQHLETDVQALDCDFLAFSGHKVYGPYGIGVLYGRAELLEAMPPYQGGGSMISEVAFEKTTYAPIPQKFEAGTPSISAAIGLGSAIDYVNALGLGNIEAHERGLLEAATRALRSVPGLRIIGDSPRKAAIVSFVFDGIHPSDIGSLVDQEGIAIRAGHHCAQPLMRRLGVPATARASFSVYNSLEDVEALRSALVKAKEFF